LFAVNVNGLDGQLVALFQLQGCAGRDCPLGVVIDQNLLELLAGERVSSVDSLKKMSFAASSLVIIAGEVLSAWNPITL